MTLPHPSRVGTVAFQPEGRERFLTFCLHSARLWRTRDRKPLGEALAHPGAALVVGLFSPDGQTVMTGATDGSVRLWVADTGKLQHHLPGHGRRLLAAAFSPDSRTLLTGGADGKAQLWDVDGGRPRVVRRERAKGTASVNMDGA